MDVERIQKINNMAVELMKQGLATNREDAVNQAEKMFKSHDGGSFSEVRQTMQGIKSDREIKVETNEKTSELSDDKIKDILQQNSQFLVKTIKSFQEKIFEMEKEINGLKISLARHRLPTVGDVLSNREAANETPISYESANKKAIELPGGAGAANHPRQGSYNSEDVSIEKFFYMGSK